MEIIIFIVIAALLLIPEFLHGWSDDGGYTAPESASTAPTASNMTTVGGFDSAPLDA